MKTKPIQLTLRRYVLLHCILYGGPPWWEKDRDPTHHEICSAGENGREWILCCGHSYSTKEIEQMVEAGWIRIDEKIDEFGRRRTTAGPNILNAWHYEHYPTKE